MLMREAPMHKNDLPPGAEHQVGLAGEILPVKAIPVAHAVHEAAHRHLRFHVLAFDAPHVFTAAFGGYPICHSRQAASEPSASCSSMQPIRASAIAFPSSGGTAFPTWTYCSVFDPENSKLSGNDWSLAASRTDIARF